MQPFEKFKIAWRVCLLISIRFKIWTLGGTYLESTLRVQILKCTLRGQIESPALLLVIWFETFYCMPYIL